MKCRPTAAEYALTNATYVDSASVQTDIFASLHKLYFAVNATSLFWEDKNLIFIFLTARGNHSLLKALNSDQWPNTINVKIADNLSRPSICVSIKIFA
jgi:hypothetical protein